MLWKRSSFPIILNQVVGSSQESTPVSPGKEYSVCGIRTAVLKVTAHSYMWKRNCGTSSHRIFCVRKWNFKSQNILRVEYPWFLMQWPEWHACTGATGPGVKAILEALLFTVPSWRWPLLGCFVYFLSYYQTVTNQLTYEWQRSGY